jgi:hypothetical protein
MLTRADDYPIHQTPEPIAYAGTDRNFYDRYFFNGYTADGSDFFAAALGVYPHLNVMDAAFCVARDGVQHNLHASRVLHMERMVTQVGPISVEVLEPLQSLRVRVAPNEHGIEADVVFHGRAQAIQEPRFTYRIGPRTIMDYTRLTQNGAYEGWVSVKGERRAVTRDAYVGTRDRSWGVRPVGAADSQPVAPPPTPQFYWLWAPMNFGDRISLYHLNADGKGHAWNTHGLICETGAGQPLDMAQVRSEIVYKSGTRHAKSAIVHLRDPSGADYRLSLTPKWPFFMSGLGYMNPHWGHGHYKGELAVGYDAIETAKVNENDFPYQHIQAFSHAVLEGPNGFRREGCGVLEQLVIGPYAPHGLTGLIDPAP